MSTLEEAIATTFSPTPINSSRRCFQPFRQARCCGPSPDRPGRVRQSQEPDTESLALRSDDGSTASIPAPLLSTGTVLLIEGQPEIRGMLRFCLEMEGYKVLDTSTDREAIDFACCSEPSAILLDFDTPNLDGLALLQRLRESSRAHIIVLSGIPDEPRKLRALDAGANDYLVRPVSMAELAARLRAAHRSGPSPVSSIFKAGELTVDLSSRTVRVSNRQVKLTATEFSLLTLFVRNAGKVLTHAQILREIWGPRMVKRLEYLRVYLKSLRAKIEMNPDAPQLLLTERLIGYQLKLPDC